MSNTYVAMYDVIYIDLPAPTNVKATVLSHCSVEVTWDELSDATEYIISYSTTSALSNKVSIRTSKSLI